MRVRKATRNKWINEHLAGNLLNEKMENGKNKSAETLLEIYNDFVIVQDGENNIFEVDMNDIIKPSEG